MSFTDGMRHRTIRDLPIAWRKKLGPASFREAIFEFHVDSGSKASGRRVAIMEFPKRNTPYSEDLGRKARKYAVQGYIIIDPRNTDYIPRRDALIAALEADGPGLLKLPTFDPEMVMCESYTCEEVKGKGGYAAFNMTFCERGRPIAYDVQPDTRGNLAKTYADLAAAANSWLNQMVTGTASGPNGAMTQDAVDAFWKGFG